MTERATEAREGRLTGRYGGFDEGSPDYVIRDPRTPRPWANVLANERYGVVLSQAGGGFSWFENCQIYRLSRWEQDLVQDAYGRFVYVQDGSGRLWSTTYRPTRSLADREEVRHGLGSTAFARAFDGIETVQRVFVPREEACELWLIEVKNLSGSPRRIRLTSYLEWHLGGVGDWHREFHRLFVECEAAGDTLFAWKHAGLEESRREPLEVPVVAFARWIGAGPVEWCASKAAFLGPCGDLSDPVALREPALPRGEARWDDPVAAGGVWIELAPGESRTLGYAIGAGEDRAAAETLAAGWSPASMERELRATRAEWAALGEATAIATPDEAMDLLTNAWMPYQAVAGRMTARCAYYQQGGAYGFRDQLQDSLVLLSRDPARAAGQIVRHAEAMYADGGVRHWWHPGLPVYVESRHSDTCLWLAFAVSEYLRETADYALLERPCAFLDRTTQAPGEEGSLLEHALRGIRRALDMRSPRGVPLIGAGDWNDGLSHAGLDGKGESFWLAMFLFDVLGRMDPILERCGLERERTAFRQEAEALRAAVEAYGWDGRWYLAGTRDDGRPLGSHENREGSLFLNPQTWAVISGLAGPERAARAMESVRERLVTDYGALLLRPAFREVDPYIGYITRYAPGVRENGGVYSHASAWAVQAFAMLGDAGTAARIYRGMAPPLRSSLDSDAYAAEPYVMPGNVDGPDSPYEGRAGWTWYTGSAAWMTRVAIEWVCGVRSTEDGLIVAPCSPPEWDRYQVVRQWRGDRFEIEVLGRGAVCAIEVDGRSHPLGPISASGRGATRRVRVAREA
jgi:cellobiose phosphorylase